MSTSFTTERKIIASFTGALAVLCVIAIAGAWSIARLLHEWDSVSRTHQVLEGINVRIRRRVNVLSGDEVSKARQYEAEGYRKPGDATGRVRFHHFGEGGYDESEHWIRTLLEDCVCACLAIAWVTTGCP